MQKKTRSIKPDVTVIVGEEGREFQCYGVILALSSEFFDNLFCQSMRENDSSKIELRDVTVEEWILLQEFFVHPNDNTQVARVDQQNVNVLLPLFHRFEMKPQVNKCDEFLLRVVVSSSHGDNGVGVDSINDNFWGVYENNDNRLERADCFENIISSFAMAVTFDLKNTLLVAIEAMMGLLAHLKYTGDLFHPRSVDYIVQALHPLCEAGNEVERIAVADDQQEEEELNCEEKNARAMSKSKLRKMFLGLCTKNISMLKS